MLIVIGITGNLFEGVYCLRPRRKKKKKKKILVCILFTVRGNLKLEYFHENIRKYPLSNKTIYN